MLLLVILLAIITELQSQNIESVQYSKVELNKNFNVNKVYNKKTGKRVSKEEFAKLIQENPNLPLESVYDKKGKIVKYYYNPQDINASFKESKDLNSGADGAFFPELQLKTITGEKINFNKLKGKLVVLRFELEADSFRFKKDEVYALDQKIQESGRADEIEAIIVFACPQQEVEQGFNYKRTTFKVVANGANIQRKLGLRSYPSIMVLDKTGKLVGNYIDVDEIKFNELE